MKLIAVLLSVLPILSCASDREKNFAGSTPAGTVVRSFLGIPLNDSIDFIRWKLSIEDNSYSLECNYGVGKPNTNGFINGGKKIAFTGEVKKEANYYELKNGNKKLKIARLNENLLHPMDEANNLLVGSSGWSYTLGIPGSAPSGINNISTAPTHFKDSLVFGGRTPCGIPDLFPPGRECYKLKWRIVLFADPGGNSPTRYRVYGTAWRQEGGKSGNLQVNTGSKGQLIYQLNDGDKGYLYLLKLDEHLLAFTDANGNLLVGDEDFSYTLNRSE